MKTSDEQRTHRVGLSSLATSGNRRGGRKASPRGGLCVDKIMQFISNLFGAIAKATLSVFIAAGLFGSATTSTNLQQNISTTTPVQVTQSELPVCNADDSNTPCTPPSTATTQALPGRTIDTEQRMTSTQQVNQTSTSNSASVMCQGTPRQACPAGQSGVCMPNGNYYCTNATLPTPQTSEANQSVTDTTPRPPAPSGTLCNGTYYSSCPTGENFVCPGSGGSAYCQAPQEQGTQATQQTQSGQPQILPQTEMNAFLNDATNAASTYQSQYNSDYSSSECMGIYVGICSNLVWGQGVILKLQNFGIELKNPYRSSSCDYQVYSPLDQAIQTVQKAVSNMIATGQTFSVGSSYQAYVSEVSNTAASAANNDESQAKIAAETCN